MSSNIPQAFVRSRETGDLSINKRPRAAQFYGKATHLARHSHSRGPFPVRIATETPPDVITNDTSENVGWFKHWWPVRIVSDLETDRPNRIRLLGEYFAVWRSKSGEWICMKDICPHRLAPLSEGMPILRSLKLVIPLNASGRIEDDGTLMCSYHGWRFNESGKCVKIPQADDEKSHEAACRTPRSCAMTYPCKVALQTRKISRKIVRRHAVVSCGFGLMALKQGF